MKKIKIVGLLVAFGGVVASFSAASALYIHGANEIGFGIGANYQAATGSITYAIDGKQSGTIAPKFLDAGGTEVAGAEGIGGTATQILFEFPVSATFGTNPQPYVVGNFAVNLTNIDEHLFNAAKIWVQVKGWSGDYVGKWGESEANSNFMVSDVTLTSAAYSVNKDIGVSATQAQNVSVYIKFTEAINNPATMLALNETKLFDISATWGQVSNSYVHAYVVGNKTSWEEDEVYAMQPNLKADSFGWYYAGLTGFSTAKVKKQVNSETVIWAPNDNVELTAAHHYNVAWNGGAQGTEGYYCSFDDLDAPQQP